MAALIEVKLTELAQLFNSMDPSPFHERDLDQDAEEFIVSWAQEHARDQELRLVLHLAHPPKEPLGNAAAVETAVRHYFAYRSGMLWREFRQLMKEGRMALAIGLLFMTSCQLLAPIIFHRETPWQPMGREGLTILGWVAMWRPLEIYLYRWWPLLRKRNIYQRLAQMGVEIRTYS
jgi:hypothetical protein